MSEEKKRFADIHKYLQKKYAIISTGPKDRIYPDIFKFHELTLENEGHFQLLLPELTKTIYRNFEFKEIGIGLLDPTINKLRYMEFLGLTEEARKNLRKCEYTQQEFIDDNLHPGVWISPLSKFFISGEAEYSDWEKHCFNRPYLFSGARENIEDDREGDYIDVFIFGKNRKGLGWFELSNTKTGKIASPESIRWIELIAMMIAPIIQSEIERD